MLQVTMRTPEGMTEEKWMQGIAKFAAAKQKKS
jgi:hypothetical protein